MRAGPQAFKREARRALGDPVLQAALARAAPGFIVKRRKALGAFPDFEALREQGREIRDHTLAHLDHYLERYEQQVLRHGGQVHWAGTAEEARAIVTRLCREAGAERVIKGKTMVGEEIAVNEALEAAGMRVVETDLGEYIIQLADEPPSHIIAPAVHKTRGQVAELFRDHHRDREPGRPLAEVGEIVDEARAVLREIYLTADVGITGANFLVAETGSSLIVTNEGNGDLSSTLPRVHIVIASIDKLVPTLDDAGVLLRLLGRSATGQAMTAYTTLSTGPRRGDDPDGPEAYHVVLVDNGRSQMLGGEFRDMLRCIRCGACLNHCPVYGAVGGHAYGWVYSGPMGSVLTPLFLGLDTARDLPSACSLNGRCADVCPVKIPLPDLLRRLRARAFERRLGPARERLGLRAWAFLARRPRLYALVTGAARAVLGRLGGRSGVLRRLPLAGGWTASRDLPAPARRSFRAQWRARASRP